MKRKKIVALGLVIALTASNSSAVWAADALNMQGITMQQTEMNTEDTVKTQVVEGEGSDTPADSQENAQTDISSDIPQQEITTEDDSEFAEDNNGIENSDAAASDSQQPEDSDVTGPSTEDEAGQADLSQESSDETQITDEEIALYADQGIAVYASLPSSIGGVSTTNILNATKVVIRKYEGSYTSVNPNDNGRLSVGKMQWNGDRAKTLLKAIVVKNTQNARSILGDSLYNEILNTRSWSKRTLNRDESTRISKLLGTTEGKQVQDAQEDTDVSAYISHIYNQGVRNAAAVLYLADVENQSGTGSVNTILSYAKNFGNISDLTLNEIHITTICYAYTNRNSWLSASDANRKSYITRRINAYTDASGQGWTYCKSGDYRMPSTSPQRSKIGVQWLQAALNRYQNAGLSVDGSYGPGTKQAVKNFQQTAGLSVDGDAGVDTIRELVRRLYYNKAINGNGSVIGGVVTDVVWNGSNWVYTVNGKVNTSFTGFAKNTSGWWYIEKGKVNFNKNSIVYGTVNGETAWWHVSGGNVKFDNSVEANEYGWFVIQNGKVNFNYNGFAKNWSGWWCIEGGAVNFNKNSIVYGTVNGVTAWWHVSGGNVKFDNSVEENEHGWFVIQNGKVNFNYNGFAKNWSGWWCIEGGAVNFNKTDVIYGTVNGVTAWWYVNGGNVKLNFNGMAKNVYGWWYIKNGKVDFSANGWKTINGKSYYVENGCVKR